MLPVHKRYWHHVDHLDVSDARKIEIINTVHRAMQSGVDRAHGDDPVQLALTNNSSKRASSASDVIDLPKGEYWDASLTQTFNDKKGMKNE